MTLKKILRTIDLISKPRTAYAHCDIPCGIYETDTATHAAHTVYVLTERILNISSQKENDPKKMTELMHTLSRITLVKEKHAQLCKEQILILWTDYFKPEHLAKYPELHEKVWKAAKQCSVAKRELNLENAQKLKDMVSEISRIFSETKQK